MLLLHAQGPKFVADLAERRFDGLHFDEKVADLFQEIVKMVRTNHVGHVADLEMADVLAAAGFRDEIEGAHAATILGGNAGKLAQGNESGAFDACQSHVRDDEGPFSGLELGQEHLGVWDDADAPPLGVQNLFDRTGTLGIVVEDKDTDLAGLDRGIGTHRTSIVPEWSGWRRIQGLGRIV